MTDWTSAPWYEGSLTQKMDRDIIEMDIRATARRARHAALRVAPPLRVSDETRAILAEQDQFDLDGNPRF